MEKLTENEIREKIQEMIDTNSLYKRVIDEIVEKSDEYEGYTFLDRLKARLDDIGHGLQTGVVGSMIYYTDTCEFFEIHKFEINELLKEEEDDSGVNPFEWLHDFDTEDRLCLEYHNQNLLAWFAYEIIANKLEWILEDIEMVEDSVK